MKLFDSVYIVGKFTQDKVPGIIVKINKTHAWVDTIIGGCWKVSISSLKYLPPLKGIIRRSNTICDKKIKEIRKMWNEVGVAKSFKTPIIKDK